MTPLVQLYCKKLDLRNVDAFLFAQPDHIGWQINLQKLGAPELDAAADLGGALAERLRSEGVRSVFLVHPSRDAAVLTPILERVRPDIFLASADRDLATLEEVRAAGVEIMTPVGIPEPAASPEGYDPLSEARTQASVADWLTTDTITARDAVDRFGCSGRTSRWDVLATVVVEAGVPVVAAGGLTPGNVDELWRLCRPAGFDAHTSVCVDGLPDRDRAVDFTRAVRALR